MTEQLAVVERRGDTLTSAEIRAAVQLIQQVMQAVMKNGVHYGTIPGTDKPTLFKAGAEKILSTFRIGVDPVVEDMSTPDEARYRVMARGFSITTGATVGGGIGEASSNEEKYKWRKAVCDEEWDETPEDRRRNVWKRGQKPYQVKQVRVNPADVANTVLKMAKKRAQIDLTLTATAASDVFAQDLEDLPEGVVEGIASEHRAPIKEPKAAKPQAVAQQEGGEVVLVTVGDIKTKSGQSSKGPWVRAYFKAGEEYYSTFDTKLADALRGLVGTDVELRIQRTSKGNNILGIQSDAQEAPEQEPKEDLF
ncbi:MAG: hypothetical protein ABIF82_05860 [Planctomycetota bacterium]